MFAIKLEDLLEESANEPVGNDSTGNLLVEDSKTSVEIDACIRADGESNASASKVNRSAQRDINACGLVSRSVTEGTNSSSKNSTAFLPSRSDGAAETIARRAEMATTKVLVDIGGDCG